MITGNSVQNPQ